jgi:hypothetical protein
LIKLNGKTEEQIFKLTKKSKVKIRYFIGKNLFGFSWNEKTFSISPTVLFDTKFDQ